MQALNDVAQAAREARLSGGLLYSLTQEQAAYLAGLFDGEGYVGIEREARKDRGGKVRYRVVVSVSNTNREVVEIMKELVGHGFIVTHKHDPEKKWKDLYEWRCKGGSAVHLLGIIEGHLRIKAPQADLVLTTPAVNEETWMEIKRLNHRGVTHSNPQATEQEAA